MNEYENNILENEFLKIELFNTDNIEDKHFSTRFNHLGYIKQITDKKSGKSYLTIPFETFEPFHGEGFPDEFEILYERVNSLPAA